MHVWEKFLETLDRELGAPTVNEWLRPLRTLNFDARNLYLEADDVFQVMWFEEHIRAKAKKRLRNSSDRPIKIHLTTKGEAAKAKKEEKRDAPFALEFDDLDPNAIFENFIPPLDPLPLMVLTQELESNPIYIYGPSGAGKSHLLMATARAIGGLYVRASTFTHHVVGAIRSGNMSLFRNCYRDVDALIIDDIEIFARKKTTQEEFFHTFNALHMSGKPVILSASCPPAELEDIEPRLMSRFEWGMALPLSPLKGLEPLLKKRAQLLQLELSPKVEQYLLTTFESTWALVRALEALALRSSGTVSLQHAEELLRDLVEADARNKLSSGDIITTVASHFAIPLEELKSTSKKRDVVLPRQIAMFFCRHTLKMPLLRIGRLFSRDHSTVMSSIRRIEETTDVHLKQTLRQLARKWHC